MKKKMVISCLLVIGVAVGIAWVSSGGYILAQVETEITIAPQTLVLSSNSTAWVTVHTDLPYGSVASASVTLDGIPIAWSKADARGYFVAKFQMAAVKGIAAPPSVELTLAGTLKDGQTFSGTDAVPVLP
ncbi:MAG TPA: hypothetical protein PLI09_16855 [Candidatus Hydrogenedentes bacterium]|nr:hypothetical protein [Candidatus Hydrogenedentota bacterium]